MKKYVAGYATTALLPLMLDLLWTGGLAEALYQECKSHRRSGQPRMGVATLFYALYPLGLLALVLASRCFSNRWGWTIRESEIGNLYKNWRLPK